MMFMFNRILLKDGFSIIKITMNAQNNCLINTDDFFNEISEAIYKKYRDFTYNVSKLEDGNIGAFYTVPSNLCDAIVEDVSEIIDYFNVLNDKIAGLEETETQEKKEEETMSLDVEKLNLSDYKNMMDAWSKEMRDKFVKEANLSKEEISEQIDESTKSFVSNIGILAQKVLYITGSKLYSHRVKIFCNECREKGIFESARSLRKYFYRLSL